MAFVLYSPRLHSFDATASIFSQRLSIDQNVFGGTNRLGNKWGAGFQL